MQAVTHGRVYSRSMIMRRGQGTWSVLRMRIIMRHLEFSTAVRPAVQLLQIQEVRTWTLFNV